MPSTKALRDYECSMYEYISGRKLPNVKKASVPPASPKPKKAESGKATESIVKKVTILTTEKPKDSKTETKPATETETVVTTKIITKSKPDDNHDAIPKLVRFDENKLEEYSRVSPSTKRAQEKSGEIYSEGGVKINKRPVQDHASDCMYCNTEKYGVAWICDTCIRKKAPKDKAKSETKDGDTKKSDAKNGDAKNSDDKNGKNGKKEKTEAPEKKEKRKDGLWKAKASWDTGLLAGWDKKMSANVLNSGDGWGTINKTDGKTTGWDATPAADNSGGWETNNNAGGDWGQNNTTNDTTGWGANDTAGAWGDTPATNNATGWGDSANAGNDSSGWGAQPAADNSGWEAQGNTNNSSGWEAQASGDNSGWNDSNIHANSGDSWNNNQAPLNKSQGWQGNNQPSNVQGNVAWGNTNNQNSGQINNAAWGNSQGQAQNNNWKNGNNQPNNGQNGGNWNNGQNNSQNGGQPWNGNQSASWPTWPNMNNQASTQIQGNQAGSSQNATTIQPFQCGNFSVGGNTVTIKNDPNDGLQVFLTTGQGSNKPAPTTVDVKSCLKNGSSMNSRQVMPDGRIIDTSKYTWVPDPPTTNLSQKVPAFSATVCTSCQSAQSAPQITQFLDQGKQTMSSIWGGGVCGCASVPPMSSGSNLEKQGGQNTSKHASWAPSIPQRQQQQPFKSLPMPDLSLIIQILSAHQHR